MMAGTLLLVVLALAAVSIGSIHVSLRADRTQNRDMLVTELTLLNQQLAEALDDVRSDLGILANTPPIQGLVRTLGTAERDRTDGTSRAEDWHRRLDEIFAAFLDLRPAYVQIRLLSADPTGQELVRVNRAGDTIEVVDQDQLQEKSGEFYFQDGIRLAPGETHVTPSTLNRENGQIGQPPTIVTRVLFPVFGEDGSRFGFLVINVEHSRFLEEALSNTRLPGDVYSFRDDGSGWHYSAGDGQVRTFVKGGFPWDTATLRALRNMAPGTVADLGDGRTAYGMSFPLADSGGEEIHRFLAVPHAALPSRTGSLTIPILVLDAFVIALAVMASAQFVHVSVRPILDMQREVQRARDSAERVALPVTRRDEIGALAWDIEALIEDLETREVRLEYLFDGVRDGICLMNSKGQITLANNALLTLLGYEASELIGQDVGILMPKDRQIDHRGLVIGYMNHGKRKRVGQTVTETACRKDGTTVEIELAVSEISRAGEVYFAALLRDVTAMHAVERERDEMVAALETSSANLAHFDQAVSQELLPPLQAVAAAADRLARNLDGTLDPDSAEALELLRTRVGHMTTLLDGLPAHARNGHDPSAPQGPIVSGDDLALAIVGLVDRPDGFTIAFGTAFIDLKVRQSPLQTVLAHLISNAIRHHDRPDGRVDIDATAEGDRIRFTVTDDGPGIAPEIRDQLFGPSAPRRPGNPPDANGSGLALCRTYVARNGGEITVRPDGVSTGTVFEFTWPTPRPELSRNVA